MNLSRPIAALLIALAAGAAQPVLAHGDMRPKHGGAVQMSGETMAELVAGPKGVMVFISEEDEPLSAAAYDAKLILTKAGVKTEVPLKAMGGNRLVAPGANVDAGTKVVVVLLSKTDGSRTFVTFPAK